MYGEAWKLTLSRRVGWGAIFFAICCVAFGFTAYVRHWQSESVSLWKWSLWAVWTISVPLWHFFEYGRLYVDNSKTETDEGKRNCSLEEFKYMQDVASRFWISVTAVLAALYAGQDILSKLVK